VSAVHPTFGVQGYRVKNFDAAPFALPKELQEKPLKLGPQDRDRDVVVPAERLNAFLYSVYVARHRPQRARTGPFGDFANRVDAAAGGGSETGWRACFGQGLPDAFYPSGPMAFDVVVPCVVPGKQMILWDCFHASAGSTSADKEPKVVAFHDMVPETFLGARDRAWLDYLYAHAPADVGSGSRSRTTWHALRHTLRQEGDAGLSALRNAKGGESERGGGGLAGAQLAALTARGFLVLDLPASLTQAHPASATLANFSKFFQTASGDAKFDVTDARHLQRAAKRRLAEEDTGDPWFYASRRVPKDAPLDPERAGSASHTAQGGGSLVSGADGMGPGTCYMNEPHHLAVQFSPFVNQVFASVYGARRGAATAPPPKLLVVLERFRAKTTSTWAMTHVDTRAIEFLPAASPLRRALGI
jgi:hypothetical protein